MVKRLARWVAACEILVAPAVALFLVFPTRFPALASLGLVALVGTWLARWVAQGTPLRPTPLNVPLLFLLAVVPVAVWASAVQDLTAQASAYLLAGVVVFAAVANWARTSERAWWVWGGLVAVGVALAVLAPLGMPAPSGLFTPPALYTRWAGRLPETINPNIMAGALVVLWPIPLAGIQFRLPRESTSKTGRAAGRTFPISRLVLQALRIAAALSALLLVATLALTQSRGAYMAFAVSALVLLALHWPKGARVVVPVVLIAAIVGVGLIGWRTVVDELMTGEATIGLDQRVEVWSRAIYAIQDFPFTGLGLGTFEPVIAVLYPLFLNPDGTVPHSHNLCLQVAVDLGLPGLVAYLALLGLTLAIILSAYRVFRRGGQRALAGLCAACIAGLVGVCVHGVVDAATWGIKLAFVPWAVTGLVVGLWEVATKQEGRADLCH